jgi:lambda family phage holin
MQDRQMNERDAGFWVDVLNGLKNAWPQILGSMMAGLICYGRLIYDDVERKNRWIEGVICGALSLCISSALDVFGLPVSMSPFIGGMVGFIGVEKLRNIAISAISKRVGASDENQQ